MPRAVVLLGALSGCGYGLMQTARPVPAGEVEVILGGGLVYNDMVPDRGVAFDNGLAHVALRYGLTEGVDLGAKLFMGLGALVDGKVNLAPPGAPVAISVQLGLGGAAATDSRGDHLNVVVVHSPVRLLASWELGPVTPYAGVGYGFFWIFGYGDPEPDVRYAARGGYGDGLLMAHAGVELFSDAAVSILIEYGYWTQVVDDPGDFFSFEDNHIVSAGVRF